MYAVRICLLIRNGRNYTKKIVSHATKTNMTSSYTKQTDTKLTTNLHRCVMLTSTKFGTVEVSRYVHLIDNGHTSFLFQDLIFN